MAQLYYGKATNLKSSDQIATDSSTTFQDVTDISFAAEANSAYYFEMKFFVNASNTSADFKYTVTAPSGATMNATGTTSTGTTASTMCTLVSVTGTSCAVGTATANRTVVRIEGLVTTAASSGNVQLRFAQNVATASVNSPTALKNSFVEYEKVQ